MLALEVALLTGRYVATSFDDRGRAEWPPHPARLFSALVATHFEALEPSKEERGALEWVERLGPPDITVSEASRREVVTVFVPVNDASVVGSLDDEAQALSDARIEIEAAGAKGGKTLAVAEKKAAKAKARLDEAVRKAITELKPGREGKDAPRIAASLLPEHRGKQPRTFPSVTPDVPRLVFAWPEADLSAHHRAIIDGLASRVVRLGHSSSLVTVRLRDDVSKPTWVPDETGEIRGSDDEVILRVVEPGQLTLLDALFERNADEPGRVMPASFQRYVRPGASTEAPAATTVFSQDWVVLRRIEGPRLPSARAVDVARMVRKALLDAYGEGAPEILSGHRAPNEPSERAHLAIVPLPFVAHDRADGSILGVALVLPSAATTEERRAVYGAVSAWGADHKDGEGRLLPVHLGRAGTLLLAVLQGEAPQSTLVANTWCQRAARWASATPLALDRNPGDLRSSDPKREAAAYSAAEETIGLSCERIGLPRPRRVTAMPAAPLAGGDKARHFPPYRTGKPPIQRVLVHATLEFDQPVEGPILLGAGRYLGLGLFRPLRDHG